MKPNSTKTNHILPYGELSPNQFERLCLWLVEREGYLRPEHLGEGGSDEGRDIVAYRSVDNSEQLWFFQCKRYQSINATKLIEEVRKYNNLIIRTPTKRPFGIIFVTNASISAPAREKVSNFCDKYGYNCEFWAKTELDSRVKKYPDIVAEFFNLTQPLHTHNKISIGQLPVTGPNLFGRDTELKLLDDTWTNTDINIITFVAWGGGGKTALINHWLKRQMASNQYLGAERVYGWSFHSQGTTESGEYAELFIDQALRWFGDTNPSQGSPWEKGERLAHFIRQTRTLLILDGLEPLQHPPGYQEGKIKDAALQTLLVELAAQQKGLCIITTRELVTDLVEFENSTVVQYNLEQLPIKAGTQLLRSLKIKGDDNELEQAILEYKGHPLALTLLGNYLDDVYEGDIQRRNEIENLEDDVRHGPSAEGVMRAYEKWLGESVELNVLRLLGLFDRPAESIYLETLCNPPAIPNLTEKLQNLPKHKWKQAVAKLRRIQLLDAALPNDPNTLNAHPLIREHFKQHLKHQYPISWREANGRLYSHLKHRAKKYPDTIEEMSLLFSAVAHACEAGLYREGLSIYIDRIQRGEELFNWKRLGAFGADLATLSNFFEIPWEKPANELTDNEKGFVLNEAGVDLRALGRLQEATKTMYIALQARIVIKAWREASVNASNLSHLYLNIGEISRSLGFAINSVELANKSGDKSWLVTSQCTLADALHQAGQIGKANNTFRLAEQLQKKQKEIPFLIGYMGFQYCDFLLGQGKVNQVKERANWALEYSKQRAGILTIALNHLLLGRANLLIYRQTNNPIDISQASELLNYAVEGLRRAGQMDDLPRGLNSRAQLYRFKSDFEKASLDLSEILRIASRSGMGLHLTDYHLETARLNLAIGNWNKANEHWITAKAMVNRMGYHRRNTEIAEIAQQLH